MDKRHDLGVALAIMLLGVLYFWAAAGAIGPQVKTEPLGEAALPRFLAVIMIVGGLWVIMVERLLKWRRDKGNIVESLGEADEPGYHVHVMRPLVLIGLLFLYVLAWPYLGYLAGTILVMLLVLVLLERRDWKRIIPLSLGLAVFLYSAFAVAFGVYLPLLPSWIN